MPRGSFLIQPARTTQELLAQFDKHPSVQKRYMAAFGRPKGETRYLLSKLQPKRLTESHRYPMAFFHGRRWGFKVSTLRKGTLVYVTPEGQPFLNENCGNPLIILPRFNRPPALTSTPVVRLPPSLVPPSLALEIPPALDAPPLSPPEFFELAKPSLPLGDFMPEGLTPELEITPEPSPGKLRVPPLPKGDDSLWLLGIPFLFLLDFGGGGGGPPGTQPPPGGGGTGVPPPAQAIPEPGAQVMLVAAGFVLIGWRLKRARSCT
jgi:hypothetical protein